MLLAELPSSYISHSLFLLYSSSIQLPIWNDSWHGFVEWGIGSLYESEPWSVLSFILTFLLFSTHAFDVSQLARLNSLSVAFVCTSLFQELQECMWRS